MSEPKVTGGAWEAIMNDDPRGQPQSGYRGLIALVEQGERYLAIVSDGRAVSRDEWEGNARMMAASKEMYEALKRVAENFKRAVAGKPVRDMAETLAEVDSALAKAEMTPRNTGER